MIPTTAIEDYYQHQHEKCRKALLRYSRTAMDEDIHCARVSMKRIKAVMSILHKVCGMDIEGHYAGYRAVFREAGRLRDATLLRDRIAADSRDTKATTHQRHIVAALSRKFRDEVPVYLKDIDYHVEDLIAEIRACQIDIPSYCSDLQHKLKKRWKKANRSGHYHSLRKHIKHFLYASELLPDAERQALLSASDQKRLDKLQDLIGLWHDHIHIDARVHSGITDAHRLHSRLHRSAHELHKQIKKTGNKIWD